MPFGFIAVVLALDTIDGEKVTLKEKLNVKYVM